MSSDGSDYLRATALLDYGSIPLTKAREHATMGCASPREKVKALYTFVSSLPLGYSANDDIAASQVLRDGYGQCNTKVTLLCALARGAGVPTRIRVFALRKEAQRGRAPDWLIAFMPKTTVFFWPEFQFGAHWIPLQTLVRTKQREWHSCPFDGARYQLEPLRREWIARDLGLWSTPDEFFRKHKPTVHGWRTLGWKLIGRRVLQRYRQRCV